jgi:hypothetical protein
MSRDGRFMEETDWSKYAPGFRGLVVVALSKAHRQGKCLFCVRAPRTRHCYVPKEAELVDTGDVRPVPCSLCREHADVSTVAVGIQLGLLPWNTPEDEQAERIEQRERKQWRRR